jgi:hypothetical protein
VGCRPAQKCYDYHQDIIYAQMPDAGVPAVLAQRGIDSQRANL